MLSAVISIYQDIHMKTSDLAIHCFARTHPDFCSIIRVGTFFWYLKSLLGPETTAPTYWTIDPTSGEAIDNGKCREFMAVLPSRSLLWRSARANLFLFCKFITTCISFPLKLDQYVYFLTMKDNANTTVVMKNRKESCIQHLDWPQGRSIDFGGPRAKRHQGPLVYGSEVFLGQGAMAPYSRIF
jgi:hypothetical protein